MVLMADMTGGRANVRNMGDVGRHLGNDGNADAALDGGREEDDQLRVLPYVAAHAGLPHLRAGEIEFDGVAAGFLCPFGKRNPLLFSLPHDGSDDHLIGILLFQAFKDVEVQVHGVFAQLFHIAEAKEIAFVPNAANGIEAGRHFPYFLQADGLVEYAAPAGVEGPRHHLIVGTHGR